MMGPGGPPGVPQQQQQQRMMGGGQGDQKPPTRNLPSLLNMKIDEPEVKIEVFIALDFG